MVWPAAIAAAAALAGGALSGDQNRKTAHEQMDMQREFAQMGIRWKVADAKAAGIHPLYALGSPGASYAPISVGDSYGPALADAGQDISRAMLATRTQEERDRSAMELSRQQFRQSELRAQQSHEMNLARAAADLEGQNLRNQAFRSAMGQVGPAMPSAVSSSAGPIEVRSLADAVALDRSRQTSHDPFVPGREAFRGEGKPGMVPYRLGGKRLGFTLDVPSSEFGEGLEGAGPAAWLLGALGIGGHYTSRFMNAVTDEYGGRELQARVYRFLQNQGVYPRRKGM